MPKKLLVIVPVLLVLVVGAIVLKSTVLSSKSAKVVPTQAPVEVTQLPPDQAPKVSLSFSSDAHYVTVNITNIHAQQIEYNLIYTATVKGNSIQTGVNASKKLNGETTYSEKQLLGSESSGHFTYHTNITDASLELTLRDAGGNSIYTATYPLTVTAGASADLQPSQ